MIDRAGTEQGRWEGWRPMGRSLPHGPWVGSGVRWSVWSVFTVLWTLALLTPEPVHVANAVLTSPARFPTAKLLHVASYAVLVGLTAWLLIPRRGRWLLLGFLSLHALGTEFLQQFVPERGPSWRDVGINHVGLALGLIASWSWWRRP
jgi:VanZ family protein